MSLHKNGEEVCELPLVHLENVGFSYWKNENGQRVENVVLRNISGTICDIPDHPQVVGLLAPSGMGKSTLLNLLCGAKQPATGSIQIYDAAHKTQSEVHQGQVGVVSQNYYVMPHYTVEKNLMLAAAKKNGFSKAEQKDKVMDYLDRFGIAQVAKLYPDQVSGGQKQRVAIAQALLCSGHYIIFDEPFSGLDPLMKEQVAKLINEAAILSELNTFIIITHDITRAIESSDMLWILGRERDENKQPIPGAYIKFKIDLASEGLAWHEDISLMPKFSEVAREVRGLFREL